MPMSVRASLGDGSALELAALKGDVDALRGLLDRGVHPDLLSAGGASALRRAAERGHLEALRLLLDRGASPNPPDEALISALDGRFRVPRSRREEVALALVRAGADPGARRGLPLALAVREGLSDVAAALIERGADVNAVP